MRLAPFCGNRSVNAQRAPATPSNRPGAAAPRGYPARKGCWRLSIRFRSCLSCGRSAIVANSTPWTPITNARRGVLHTPALATAGACPYPLSVIAVIRVGDCEPPLRIVDHCFVRLFTRIGSWFAGSLVHDAIPRNRAACRTAVTVIPSRISLRSTRSSTS